LFGRAAATRGGSAALTDSTNWNFIFFKKKLCNWRNFETNHRTSSTSILYC